MAFLSTKLAFFLCCQCTYLTQETDALQEGCDCLPCSDLKVRLCHGIWAVAAGREQHGQGRGRDAVTSPLQSTWGAWCPLCSLLLLQTRPCQPGPFVAAGLSLLLPRVQSKSCVAILFPVLPLRYWCTPAAWQSSVQGWDSVLPLHGAGSPEHLTGTSFALLLLYFEPASAKSIYEQE